jgi:hypothetical protein
MQSRKKWPKVMHSGEPPGDFDPEMPDLPGRIARLPKIQRGPDPINAFPGQTGLTLGL